MMAIHVFLALLDVVFVLGCVTVVVGGTLFAIAYMVMGAWYTLKGEKW